ncbi:MAG: hypothetical protein PHE89_02645 [Alphaproteobacteria bacterium]|nr:hypothetical protein [Alphaproteobacteria bacterium]
MKKFLGLFTLFLCGCTTHLTDLSMISNKNINLNEIDIDRSPQRKYVIGEDKKFILIFFPLGQPKIKEALNDALEKGNGDLMIDASLYVTSWWFIVGQTGIEIKGTVVNTKGDK